VRYPHKLSSATEQNKLGYDVDGYKYKTGYEVEEVMGIQDNKGLIWVLYLVKWMGYPEEEDWTEEPYENIDDKRLLKEYHRHDPQAAKNNRIKLKVELVHFPHEGFLTASKIPDEGFCFQEN
jgi:hypothetical protein